MNESKERIRLNAEKTKRRFMTEGKHALAVLIPCFNCGEAVVDVIHGCEEITSLILAVNDGSLDDTGAHLARCGVETMSWPENRGKGAALRAGFDFWLAREGWDSLVTIDSDRQHDPADLPRFLKAREQSGADFIAGRRRFQKSKTPTVRRLANRISTSLIRRLTGCPLNDIQSGYRLFSRHALETLAPELESDEYAIETEMALLAAKHGLKMDEIEIEAIYTEESAQRSKWKPFLDSWRIAKTVWRHA